MKVRYINQEGCAWDFDTIGGANESLKKGWREKAVRVSHPSGDWLEVAECDEETYERYCTVPFATS
jgi:hypothetical protein